MSRHIGLMIEPPCDLELFIDEDEIVVTIDEIINLSTLTDVVAWADQIGTLQTIECDGGITLRGIKHPNVVIPCGTLTYENDHFTMEIGYDVSIEMLRHLEGVLGVPLTILGEFTVQGNR